MTGAASPRLRVLFVMRWLVVGGEETELRLLARHLDPARYSLDALSCVKQEGMTDLTHELLEGAGVPVDRTAYGLSFDQTVEYLQEKMRAYDIVVACQAVPDVYPALERMTDPPALIEHGGVVDEIYGTPKHLTARYVGVCTSIRDAAAAALVERPDHALEIPSMVDLSEFDPGQRPAVRAELGVAEDAPLVAMIGRLDRRKRVEAFLSAAAVLHARRPAVRFVVVGGPWAFQLDYAEELQDRRRRLGLDSVVTFLGDRPDVPRLMSGLDVLVWLSRDEGMPHVIAEAGAARLAVVATRDNGSVQQITDGVSGLLVSHHPSEHVAAAVERLLDDPVLRLDLGEGLRRTVEERYSAATVTRRWEQLFDEVAAERSAPMLTGGAS